LSITSAVLCTDIYSRIRCTKLPFYRPNYLIFNDTRSS